MRVCKFKDSQNVYVRLKLLLSDKEHKLTLLVCINEIEISL